MMLPSFLTNGPAGDAVTRGFEKPVYQNERVSFRRPQEALTGSQAGSGVTPENPSSQAVSWGRGSREGLTSPGLPDQLCGAGIALPLRVGDKPDH